MKKIVITVCLLLIACSVSAEIQKDQDKAHASSTIASILHSGVNPWDTVKFFRATDPKGNPDTIVMFFLSDPGLWFFQETDMDIKIDDTLYKAKFVTSKNTMDTKIHKETNMAAYLVDPLASGKIMHAQKIIVTIHFTNNKPDIIWTVPEIALKEWKQVLEPQ
jgi:hypothetical protein